MKKKITTRDIKNQQTRQLILATANKLFKVRRYEDVSIKDICAECGVSVGAFYHHFKSKEQLVELFYLDFDHYLGQYADLFAQLPAYDALCSLVSHEMDYLETDITYPTQICVMQLLDGGNSFNQSTRTYYSCMQTVAKKFLSEGVITGLTIEQLLSRLLRCVRGVLYDWCLHGGSYNLKECALQDVHTLIAGLSAIDRHEDAPA